MLKENRVFIEQKQYDNYGKLIAFHNTCGKIISFQYCSTLCDDEP